MKKLDPRIIHLSAKGDLTDEQIDLINSMVGKAATLSNKKRPLTPIERFEQNIKDHLLRRLSECGHDVGTNELEQFATDRLTNIQMIKYDSVPFGAFHIGVIFLDYKDPEKCTRLLEYDTETLTIKFI